MNAEFWYGKRVLITGHTGFKGSWLSLWLQDFGANLVGYSLAPPSQPNLFEVADVRAGMLSLQGDIRDLLGLKSVIAEHNPEIVIHLAAQSLVRYSYEYPVETYATNVMGTVHLLESIRHTPSVKAVLVISSDKCYENNEWLWGYRENEAMGGIDPYSNSKGCVELITSAYRQSFFDKNGHPAAVASARAGNVIGGGDWAKDRLIPDMVRAIADKKPVLIRNPNAIRPWQHVLEPLSGYLLLAEQLYLTGEKWTEGWNFGPNDHDAQPVQWLVESFTRFWGKGAKWKLDHNEHPHEACYLKLDCSKARMRLDWQPRWNLAQTLERVVSWYQAHQEGKNMRTFTLDQIHSYQEQ